ncbi:hypothetical protein BMS3Abin11_00088 [bacterium BMS3Abin11]|nr:hypothetical protein BMS3Abin11_00088 [bacterium BMS3Abin11]
MYKSLFFILVLQVLLYGSALGADNEGVYIPKGIGLKGCNEFLHEYGSAGIEKTNTGFRYNIDFGNYIGWFQGYLTRVNLSISGKNDYFSDVSILDVLGWVGSWCRENPNKNVAKAMYIYTGYKVKEKSKLDISDLEKLLLSMPPATKLSYKDKLDECEAHLKANRLTTGQSGNAYDCYNQIRTLYVENQDAAIAASDGIRRISNKYITRTKEAIDERDFRKAKINLKKLESVDPFNSSINGLTEQLSQRETDQKIKLEDDRKKKIEIEAARIKREVERVTAMTHLSSAEQVRQLPIDVLRSLVTCMVGPTNNPRAFNDTLRFAQTSDGVSREALSIWSMAPCD